jgi:hypothetical protein
MRMKNELLKKEISRLFPSFVVSLVLSLGLLFLDASRPLYAPSAVAWGENTDGHANIPAGLTNLAAIAGLEALHNIGFAI